MNRKYYVVVDNQASSMRFIIYPNLNKIWKDKDITITTKFRIVNALVFSVVLYHGCESWTIRKAERIIIDSFELWCWRRLLRISSTATRANKSVIKEIKAINPLETLIKEQQLSYFGHIFVNFVSGFSCRHLRMKPYFIQSFFPTTSISLRH